MTPIEALIERLLDSEGGVADAGDGKGVTRFGQTAAWLAQFNLSPPTDRHSAGVNYLTWLEEVGLLPIATPGDSLSDVLVDFAVMSGAPRAVQALQGALRVRVDGVVGPATLAAVSRADRRQLARELLARVVEFQGRVITDNPQRAADAAGWARRVAGHVRRLA